MLFSHYHSVYITEDKKTIRTGKFKYNRKEGYLLTNVDIEEDDMEIKVHGYLRMFSLHCDDDNMFPYPNIPEDKWKNYCIKDKDYYIVTKKKGWFKKEYEEERHLRYGAYMKKETKEMCFVFHKTAVVEEYCE